MREELVAANQEEASRAVTRADAYLAAGDLSSALRMLRLAYRLAPSDTLHQRIQQLSSFSTTWSWPRGLRILPEYRTPLIRLYTAVLLVAIWRYVIAGYLFPPLQHQQQSSRRGGGFGVGVGVFPGGVYFSTDSGWTSILLFILPIVFNLLFAHPNRQRRR